MMVPNNPVSPDWECSMEFDWTQSDQKLFDVATAAIKAFATKNGKVEVCSFFFDCDEPQYGRVWLSLDSLQHNMRQAMELEEYAVENRAENLIGEITWQWAEHQLCSPVLSPFNTESGDFEFLQFRKAAFPEWRKLAKSGDFPKGEEHDDDYLDSNVRLVVWRVVERMVAEDSFAPLTQASPFMIGYSMHDQESAILRILNWPRK